MTGDERWYIVGALDDLPWTEAFSANGRDGWRAIATEPISPYISREAVEAAWSRRHDPRETDRIVEGAEFDAIKAIVRAHRAVGE